MPILYCMCAHRNLVPAAKKQRLLDALKASSTQLTVVDDLCGLAARRDPCLAALAGSGDLTVVACYPRAVRWLLDFAELPQECIGEIKIVNARTDSVASIVRQCHQAQRESEPAPDEAQADTVRAPENREPWFPVIDYERCVNCGQCLNFCLFGVYEKEADHVKVTHPENCKNNCPACARVCPHVAIIFPKLDETPINGAPITPDILRTANVRTNLQELLMGNEMDVYRALNHRLEAARARRLLRDNARKQAVAERRACSAVRPAKPAPARDEAATEESRADGLTS